jgi:hypothetical protein
MPQLPVPTHMKWRDGHSCLKSSDTERKAAVMLLPSMTCHESATGVALLLIAGNVPLGAQINLAVTQLNLGVVVCRSMVCGVQVMDQLDG